ncbi:hypothetical protein COBT_001591 [Conglomerata obtusa]
MYNIKRKRFWIEIGVSIPFIPLIYIFYVFTNQRKDFYGSCSFEFKIQEKHNIYSTNGFDTYIIEKNHNIDLIFFHGVAIEEEFYKKRIEFLKKQVPYNIVLPFYRNFCTSTGNISDITTMADICQLRKLMLKRNKKIIVYGLSFGAAAAVYFAKDFHYANLDNILLENPFYDLKSVVKHFPVKRFFDFLITDNWPTYTYIAKVKCRITFFLSRQDALIRYTDGLELNKLCKNSKAIVFEQATHSDAYEVEEYYPTEFSLNTTVTNK